jgi:hypothetical protein
MIKEDRKFIVTRKRFLECLGWFLFGFVLQWLSSLSSHDMNSFLGQVDVPSHVEIKQQQQQQQQQHNSNSNTITAHKIIHNGNLTINHDHGHDINSDDGYPFNSTLKFVFVVGLEGTGHHLMGKILVNSPVRRNLERLGIGKNSDFLKRLHKSLYDSKSGLGLWDAHCYEKNVTTMSLKRKLTQQLVSLNTKLTQQLSSSFRNDSDDKSSSIVTFPVNTLGEINQYGEVSYPNFMKPCRFLSYPNLDLWYEICDNARVDCEHVYLYRDPAAILQSTSINRDFNPSVFAGFHLYVTMLHIVASQLETYADRTIGCYGFYEADGDTSSWWDDVRFLGGWGTTDKTRYKAYIKKLYKAPSPVEVSLLSDDYYDIYMKPLQMLHERVIRICQDGRSRRNIL